MKQWMRTTILGILFVGLVAISGCAAPAPTPTATPKPAAQAPAPSAPTQPAAQPTPTAKPAAPSPTPATKGVADLLQKAAGIKGMRFEQVITAPTGDKFTSKTAMKGNKFRMESYFMGQTSTFIADTTAKVAYILVPEQKMAMKMAYEQFEQAGGGGSPTEQTKGIDPNARIAGTEVIDGKTTTIVEFTSPEGTAKAWLWNDYGIPIKMEVKTPQGTSTIEYKNIDTSEPPDSLFEVPAGYQILEVPMGPPGGVMPPIPPKPGG